MCVTSKVSSNASSRPSGRSSTRATSPTWIRSTFDWVWSAKIPPNSTRNISGKTIAKNTDDLSRRKPRRIASDSARNGCRRAACSCAVLPPGEVEEDVLEGAGLHLHAVELLALGQPGEHRGRRRVVSTSPSARLGLVDAGELAGVVDGQLPGSTVIRVGASRPRISAAGVSSRRIRPWSMIATRSHSTSASSM